MCSTRIKLLKTKISIPIKDKTMQREYFLFYYSSKAPIIKHTNSTI